MASPTYVLNEEFLLRDVYSRIENLCNQVEKNKVKRPSIVAMMKRYILRVVTYGGGALADDYITYSDEDIVGSDDQLRTVSLADFSATTKGKIISIKSVIEPDSDFIVAGDDGIYDREYDYDAWMRLRKNTELNDLTRHYYYEGGKKQLEIWIGSSVAYDAVGTPQVRIVYVRQPWTAFTETDVEAADAYVDLPSIYLPYMENGCAVECLKEAGVKDNQMSDLADQTAKSVTDLNNYIMAMEDRTEKLRRDA